LKIYVASKFENKQQVRAVQQRLIDLGHTISHDWTNEAEGDRKGPELDAYLQECAIKDYNGVLEADAVLLITQPNMRGAFTELGMALAWGRVCYVVGRTGNIFEHLPTDFGMRIFGTVDLAIQAIQDDEFTEAF
jgi:hypothetical protein